MSRQKNVHPPIDRLLSTLLGRPPYVPVPSETAPPGSWITFTQALSDRDPEASKLLSVILEIGRRVHQGAP